MPTPAPPPPVLPGQAPATASHAAASGAGTTSGAPAAQPSGAPGPVPATGAQPVSAAGTVVAPDPAAPASAGAAFHPGPAGSGAAGTAPGTPTSAAPAPGAPAPDGLAPAAPAGTAPHLQGPAPGLQPPAGSFQAPAVSPVPGTGHPAAPAAPPAALATQLSRPVTALAGKAPGEHVLVLKVTPEDLGPVTVRALIGADSSVRVELFAPTDGGRDALKAVLAELKRDLAGSGLNASLDLSSRNQPGEPGAEGSRRGPAQQHPGRSPAGRDDDAPQPDRRPRLSDDAPSLNVMA